MATDHAAEATGGAAGSAGAAAVGYNRVSPWVVSRDADRPIAFRTATIGAEGIGRLVADDGRIGHAGFRIGDSVVLAFDARPHRSETPALLRLYVGDGDGTFRRATAAGATVATVATELTELFWGYRVGRLRDPLGNRWWIQQRGAALSPEEIARRMADPRYVAAMRLVEGADLFPGNGRGRRRRGQERRRRGGPPSAPLAHGGACRRPGPGAEIDDPRPSY